MKKLITPILFLFCVPTIVAQTDTADYYSPSKLKLAPKDRVSASISMGAGLSFLNSANNSAYTSFIAPKIGYQVNSKFKLNIGLMHYTATGNTFMMMNRNEAIYNPSNKTISGNLLFVEGEYQLNKRMIMSGAVMYDANGFNADKQNNYKAASLGLEYKVSKHSSIKVQTIFSQGQGYYNPTINPFPSSGFSSFGTGFSNGNSMFR